MSVSRRSLPSASSIEASVSRPLNIPRLRNRGPCPPAAPASCSIASSLPLRDRRASRLDQILPLELAAALHTDDAGLNDAVVLLVRPDAVEGRLVHPEAELRDALRLAVLLVDDREPHGRAVRGDRLDDQVVVLRGRIVFRDPPDAGKLARPRHD